MLMKTPFLTADDLGLNPDYHRGLLEVLEKLEAGWFIFESPHRPQVPNGFSMATAFEATSCGTVGCIAGWAAFFSGDRGIRELSDEACDRHLHAHQRLIIPPNWATDNSYTPDRAARALRAYLLTGEPDWSC